MFNDHMNSYVPDREQDALQSVLVLDLSLATDKPKTIILGGIELPLSLDNDHEGEWTNFADDNARGPRGWHRSTQPVDSFMAYVGPRHAPSASYRTVVLGDAMYRLVPVVGEDDRYEVIVKFKSVTGAGEIDFPFADYTLSDDLQERAERVFRFTLAAARDGDESGSGWSVVGARGVEFQEPPEVVVGGADEVIEEVS